MKFGVFKMYNGDESNYDNIASCASLQLTTVSDYCVTYACHQDFLSWEVRADACLCYDIQVLEDIDSSMPKDLKRYSKNLSSTIKSYNQKNTYMLLVR